MKPLKPGDRVIVIDLATPDIYPARVVSGPLPARRATKLSSAHLSADPSYGAGYDAIFGKKKKITAEEALLN